MGFALTVHSHKGGTGKTSIVANLAALFAKKTYDTCLVDYDFRAPSQHVLFRSEPEHWINDYLDGGCGFEECLVDLTDRYGTKGKLVVAFSNPDPQAILEMMTKDKAWQSMALRRIMEARDTLFNDLNFDVLIFDTSPGIHSSAVDAIAVSDAVILVVRNDSIDLAGARFMVKAIYQALGKKTSMIINKVVSEKIAECGIDRKIDRSEELDLTKSLGFDYPVSAVIPCYCELMLDGGRTIQALHNPNHPFVEKLTAVAQQYEHSELRARGQPRSDGNEAR